jgi:hypothetical protein
MRIRFLGRDLARPLASPSTRTSPTSSPNIDNLFGNMGDNVTTNANGSCPVRVHATTLQASTLISCSSNRSEYATPMITIIYHNMDVSRY